MSAERRLAAGPLRARLVGADLRSVTLRGRELLRRVAVVVRDDAWGTVPAELEAVRVEEAGGRFAVRASARCRRPPLDVRWTAELEGRADGTLHCRVRLEPLAAFPYNRMGLVLLHPPGEVAGRPYAGRGDERVAGRLPDLVGPQREVGGVPQPLFPAVDELALTLDGGLELRLAFAGDRFEMEDQRNWTDGSFKTYSTPLALGTPHHAEPGRVIAQEVRLSAVQTTTVPALGVCLGDRPLDAAARGALAALAPAHLRVELRGGTGPGEAAELGVPLELAVHDARAAAGLDGLEAPVARVLLLGPEALACAGDVRAALPGVPVCGGTDGHFADLNRERPDLSALDGVAFPVTPQVHGFDDDTLREGLEGQRDAVRAARELLGPVHVSPVTLRPRAGPGSEPRDGAPARADPRQATPFGAAWTFGSIAALAAGGAVSASYYELAGPRGVVSADGAPYPLLDVLRRLGPLAGMPAHPLPTPDPLALAGFAAGGRVYWGNLTGSEQRIPEGGVLGPYALLEEAE